MEILYATIYSVFRLKLLIRFHITSLNVDLSSCTECGQIKCQSCTSECLLLTVQKGEVGFLDSQRKWEHGLERIKWAGQIVRGGSVGLEMGFYTIAACSVVVHGVCGRNLWLLAGPIFSVTSWTKNRGFFKIRAFPNVLLKVWSSNGLWSHLTGLFLLFFSGSFWECDLLDSSTVPWFT